MRTSSEKLSPSVEKEVAALFPRLLSDLRTKEEIQTFLTAFLSKKEYEVFTKRLAIMLWMSRSKSYRQIRAELKVSSATIASALTVAAKKEMTLTMKILRAEEWANKVSERLLRFVGK